MINEDLAYRIRYENGWLLPSEAEYTDPRLKEIAIRQEELMKEMDKLDREIKDLYFGATTDNR